jgi:hypothetical protein
MLRGEGGRRRGQGVEGGDGKGTRTESSRRCNGREQQKTAEAEGESKDKRRK